MSQWVPCGECAAVHHGFGEGPVSGSREVPRPQVATRVFDRKTDAVAWEQEQSRRLRLGEWIDPRRGRVTVSSVAESWLASRAGLKRRTRETDEAAWWNYVAPRFADWPVASLTAAEVQSWVAGLVTRGLTASTATRALAVLRGILAHAVADDRLTRNVASEVKPPRASKRREGRALTLDEARALYVACKGQYAELVLVLALTGMRWGELAGLQVGDLVSVPGRGLRLQRAVLASQGGGELYEDTLKTGRARTVPLADELVPIVDRWAESKAPGDWLFPAPGGGPLRESNWKRSVHWREATAAIGVPTLRVHDLRHTAASVWLAVGADAKVVQRVLGHATATMTLDLYGHLTDANLWDAAKRLGGTSGARGGQRGAGRRRRRPVAGE